MRIKTGKFEDAPAIAPNYLSTPEDRQVAADSLRVTRRLVSQSAMAKYQPEEFRLGVQFQTDDVGASGRRHRNDDLSSGGYYQDGARR